MEKHHQDLIHQTFNQSEPIRFSEGATLLRGADTLIQMNRQTMRHKTVSHRRVFKDYILSSEVFYIETSLN